MPLPSLPVVSGFELGFAVLAVTLSFLSPLLLTLSISRESSSVEALLGEAERTYALLGSLLRETALFCETHGERATDKAIETLLALHALFVDLRTLFALAFVALLYGLRFHCAETKESLREALRPFPQAVREAWLALTVAVQAVYASLTSKEFVQFIVTIVIVFTLRDVLTDMLSARVRTTL